MNKQNTIMHNKVSGQNAATRDDEEGINKTQTFSPQNYDNNQQEMGKKRLAERRNYEVDSRKKIF